MILGDYELGPQVGTGGMGAVHLAHDIHTRTPVALKRIHLQYAEERTTLRRFSLEIQTASKLRHPNIVSVIDSGMEPRGTPYCVMDWVSGMPLTHWTREQLPWEHVSWILADLLSALAYAHARGVVHRDLKPANILVEDPFSANPQVRLVDFGIARLLEPPDDAIQHTALTLNDRVLGTPAYLSPEQAQGFTHLIGPHTDIYSVGIILYEMIMGRLPFSNNSVVALLTAHATKQPPPLDLSRRKDVPRLVLEVLRKMLEKSPDARPHFARTVRDALKIKANPMRAPLPRVDSIDESTVELSPTMVDTRSDVLTPTLSNYRPATIDQRWTHEPVTMLGRERERDHLEALAEAVIEDRRSRLVFVHGVAGIGKTRLCREVRHALEELGLFRGARLYSQSSGAEGDAVRALLARLLLAERLSGPSLHRRLKDVAALYRLTTLQVHALFTWFSEEEDDGEADISGRIELAAEILRRVASRGPLALILEGADDHSSRFTLAVLENLFGDLATNAVLFVLATSRTAPHGIHGAMGELFELLRAENRASEVSLGPLSHETLADLVRPVVHEQADEIARRAEGNPMFAVELARLRTGQKLEDDAHTLPQSMGGVWDKRISAVLEDADDANLSRAMLLGASVLGPAVPKRRLLSVVGDAVGRSIERCEAALDTWLHSEVLLEDTSREPTVGFLHEAAADHVREHPDTRVDEVGRLIDHLSRDVLSRRGGMTPGGILAVAEWVRKERPDRARSLQLLAGELYVARLEYQQAHEQFQGVMESAGSTSVNLSAALQDAELYIVEGELAVAAGLLEEVEGALRSDAPDDRSLESSLLEVKALLSSSRGQYRSAADLLARAVRLVADDAPPVQVAEVRLHYARALDLAGSMSEGERQCRAVVKALRKAEAPSRLQAEAHVLLATLCRGQGRQPEAVEAARQALSLAEPAGARQQVDQAIGIQTLLASDAGDLERALSLGARLLDERTLSGDSVGVCRAHSLLGQLEREAGHLGDSMAHLNAAAERLTRSHDALLTAENEIELGLTNLELDRLDVALPHVKRATDLCRELGDPKRAASALIAHSQVLWASSRPVKAQRLANQALQALASASDLVLKGRAEVVLGLIGLDRDDLDVARQHLTNARNTFAAMGVYRDRIVSETWLALVESKLGLHPAPHMSASRTLDDLRAKPVYSRKLNEGLERLGDSIGNDDRDLAWRLQDRARSLENRLQQRRST